MEAREKELVELLSGRCKNLGDVQAMLKTLFSGTIEQMLEAEMEEHLGYERHSAAGNNSGNSRNGYGKKTLKTELGETDMCDQQMRVFGAWDQHGRAQGIAGDLDVGERECEFLGDGMQ